MRNKSLFVFLCAVACALVMVSCDKLESSDNGNLDGNWHLTRIDTLSTGGTLDLSGQRRFVAIQMHLAQFFDADGGTMCLSRFEHAGDTLRFHDFCLHDRASGDPALDNVELLRPYGINSLDEAFSVITLTSGKMTLEGNALRLWFTKM